MGEANRRARVPSLIEYLASEGIAVDGGGVEFAALAEVAAGHLTCDPLIDPREAMMMRLTKIGLVAAVEGLNREARRAAARGGASSDVLLELVGLFSRAMGCATAYAVMSLNWKDDTPMRAFAAHFAAEFREGIKITIDASLE